MTGTGRGVGADPTAIRSQVKRLPENAVNDPAVLAAVLDAGVVAHVGVVQDGWPYVVPVGYAPWRDGILIHGSTASRLFKMLAAGAPACVTVTHLDGLSLARSAFHSSMEYRTAMLFGTFVPVTGEDKATALADITEHLLPGRWQHVRHPTAQEDKATSVLHLVPVDWSVKISEGFEDESDDIAAYPQLWAGRVPLRVVAGEPIPDAAADHVPLPEHVAELTRARR